MDVIVSLSLSIEMAFLIADSKSELSKKEIIASGTDLLQDMSN